MLYPWYYSLVVNSIPIVKVIGHGNINFNYILATLQWFLLVELYRYLCLK